MPTNRATSNTSVSGSDTSQTGMKLYRLPLPDGPRQVTFKELQDEAVAMLASVARQPFSPDRAACNFSEELCIFTSRKSGDNHVTLLMAAWLLSVATEEAAT